MMTARMSFAILTILMAAGLALAVMFSQLVSVVALAVSESCKGLFILVVIIAIILLAIGGKK